MEYTFSQYQESAEALKDRLGAFRPRCLLILGSGLGSLGNEVEAPVAVSYADVPHMKRSTAPDHAGRFVFGRLAGQDVAVMQGRLHTYEGWSFEDVSYPVRVLRLLGAETLVVTNAAGAVNTAFSAGDIMLITDHIKIYGVSPLCGPNLEEFGPRFPDMSHVYTPRLQDAARQAAAELDISLREGVYMYFPGPQYETPAEVRAARLLGAETLVVTNAAGAVNTAFSAGDIMLITDHTKLFGVSPLCGPNLEEFGPRFPDMSHVYTPRLQDAARQAAEALSIPLRQGVYMYFPGPQYETPAEVRAARILGADAVGMSTVPEAIVAAHCGMEVLGFTLCTNMAAGVLDQPLSSDEVIAAGQAAGPRFSALVKACLTRL